MEQFIQNIFLDELSPLLSLPNNVYLHDSGS